MQLKRNFSGLGLIAAVVIAACYSTGGHGDLSSAAASLASQPPNRVSLRTPSGEVVSADLYGAGDRGVVLVAHGGYSTKRSWEKQARVLAEAGFRVLAFDSRAGVELAAGKETPCLYDEVCQAVDVLSAVRYLRQIGAKTVSIIGGSLGGGAAAHASVEAAVNEIDRIVLLAPSAIAAPEKMKARKLFIATRNDANAAGLRLPSIQSQYDKAGTPKRFVLLEGSAHGQRIFGTEHGDRVMREILRFLLEP